MNNLKSTIFMIISLAAYSNTLECYACRNCLNDTLTVETCLPGQDYCYELHARLSIEHFEDGCEPVCVAGQHKACCRHDHCHTLRYECFICTECSPGTPQACRPDQSNCFKRVNNDYVIRGCASECSSQPHFQCCQGDRCNYSMNNMKVNFVHFNLLLALVVFHCIVFS